MVKKAGKYQLAHLQIKHFDINSYSNPLNGKRSEGLKLTMTDIHILHTCTSRSCYISCYMNMYIIKYESNKSARKGNIPAALHSPTIIQNHLQGTKQGM
jgi:hypothetical protein